MRKIKNALGQEGNEIIHCKDTDLARIYEQLQKHTESATMVAAALNIYRPSLCRRKRDLEASGRLAVAKKSYCKVTGRLVQFLTTNPHLMPRNSQLNLFQ